MTRPVIGVASNALGDVADLAARYAEDAELREVNLADVAATARTTSSVDGIVVTLQRLSADIIGAFAPTVRVIGRAGVGLDTIDLDCAAANGIAVLNQPAYGATEVASHAIAMMLALQRQLVACDTYVRDGWRGPLGLAASKPVDELCVAVVGGGRIGQEFIAGVRALVGEVVVYDPAPVELPPGVRRADGLAAALRGADVLSLHLPLSENTRDLIGIRELRLLADAAIVLNVSRGGIVDEDALAAELRAGRLGGAGLDVFDREPLPADSPLLQAPNTILTPHSAATSARALRRLSTWTIGDSIEYLQHATVTHGDIVVAGAERRPEVTVVPP